MEPTWRQLEESKERPQLHKLTGTIDCSQDAHFGAFVGQTLVRQREARASQQGERESTKDRELLHASPELQDYLLKFRCPQVRHVQAHHDARCLANPPTRRRARDPEIRRDGHVPGAVDESSSLWS
jgi:hypothetical protein